MNLSLSRFKIFTFFLFAVAVIFSCTKIVTTNVGAGLIPPVDGVLTKDTVLDVLTKNAGYDTIAVGISDDHVLGYVNDPVFGKTKASLNFQIAPTIYPFSFGYGKDSIVIDSVVLCLSYHSAWGDTITDPHLRLHVYTMDPEVVFKNDSGYSNNRTFEKAQEITEFGTAADIDISKLNNVDSTDFNKEPTYKQIRIRLNNSFGQHLIDADSATVYQNDSTFYNYVRGIIIEPDETGNALLRVNLLDTATHLSLYYHTSSRADTATRRFAPNVISSASSNTISRNYDGTQIPAYVSSADSNQDFVFMQTSPGTYANINIKSVLGMPNAIIHRAEILMYQAPDPGSDKYFTPPNLFLSAVNEDSGRRFVIPHDISFSTTGSISNLYQFGVSPKTSADGATYYSFDISRYVQGIVTKNEKLYNLVLTAPYNQYVFTDSTVIFAVPISSPALNTVGVGRVRLGGGTNSQYKMRLHIVYSPL